MNPFTLPGPEFLVFYAVLAAVVGSAVLLGRGHLGADGAPTKRLTDPYAIALVRGGQHEVVRIGVMSLVRRGLLQSSGRSLQAVAGAEQHVRDALERTVLRACTQSVEGHDLLRSPRIGVSLQPRTRLLEEAGLIPDAALRLRYHGLTVLGLGILGGVGLTKLYVALNTGHHNVLFLVALMVATCVVVGRWFFKLPTATPRGRRLLAELGSLFGSLRGHAVASKQDEALFLAAIYGATALTVVEQGIMRRAFASPPTDTSNSSSSCGSSSSCSSSSSSSSSSCGGGGCGGCGS